MSNLTNITSAIKNTVSISLFNRGLAGQVFEDVKRSGAKVVMKNNAAECVLLSPEEYVSMMEKIEEARLMAIAVERLAHYDPNSLVTLEEVDAELGIKPEDLEGWEDVEFE